MESERERKAREREEARTGSRQELAPTLVEFSQKFFLPRARAESDSERGFEVARRFGVRVRFTRWALQGRARFERATLWSKKKTDHERSSRTGRSSLEPHGARGRAARAARRLAKSAACFCARAPKTRAASAPARACPSPWCPIDPPAGGFGGLFFVASPRRTQSPPPAPLGSAAGFFFHDRPSGRPPGGGAQAHAGSCERRFKFKLRGAPPPPLFSLSLSRLLFHTKRASPHERNTPSV